MSARKKLNTIYFFVATTIALVLGYVSSSITVFAVSLALLTTGLLHDGAIRPDRRRH